MGYGNKVGNLDSIAEGSIYNKVKSSELVNGQVKKVVYSQNLIAPSQSSHGLGIESIFGIYYRGQTFKANKTGTLNTLKIWIEKIGSPSDLIVEIQALTLDKPNGVVLATEIIVADSIGADVELTINFSSPTSVIAGTSYAYVLKQQSDGGNISNRYDIYGESSNLYANGTFCYSQDGGSSWLTIDWDNYFIVTITGEQGSEIVELINNGQLQNNLDANSKTITNLKAPSANGEVIRQTAIINENNLEDAVTKKHTQNTDIKTTLLINEPDLSATSDYTLILSDDGKLIELNKATAITLTIPKNSSVAFPIGTQITINQKGAGAITVTPIDGDVILNKLIGLVTVGQYAMASLIKIDTNTWQVSGDLEV